jgi:hypothetical protein
LHGVDGGEIGDGDELGLHARHSPEDLVMFEREKSGDGEGKGRGKADDLRDARTKPDRDGSAKDGNELDEWQPPADVNEIADQRDEDAEWAREAVQRRLTGRLKMREPKATRRVLGVKNGNESVFPGAICVMPVEEANQNGQGHQHIERAGEPARVDRCHSRRWYRTTAVSVVGTHTWETTAEPLDMPLVADRFAVSVQLLCRCRQANDGVASGPSIAAEVLGGSGRFA